ncbi:MAG: primosomal protein N', partial [Negativicutes bacterium]|nr:primosomal protein N' [Negativicutes bacterium]
MGRIAQVLVNIPTRQINKCFSYSVPDAFSFVGPGWRVWVSFGGRETEGFVTALEEGDEENLKEIAAVWDDEPWFDDNMLATARWISNYYLCSFSEALRLFVPGGATRISSIAYTACPPGANGEHDAARDLKREHAEVFSYIQAAGPVGRDKLVKRYGAGVVRSVQFLLRRKLIKKQVNATSRAKPRFEHIYRLTAAGEEAAGKPDMLKGKPAQRRLLELLSAVRELTGKQVKERKFNRTALVRLVEAGFISAERVRLLRDSYADAAVAVKRVKLTTQQEAALAAVRQAITSREFKSFLLHGTTGSGKTEVYMEAAAAARQANRQVIVLVPEIALTGQVVNRFKARFGDDVTVIHSKLSLAERYDAWERLRSGSAGIAIGARSAVFSPLAAIGLIILDEEHEFTYKQEETPRYHARDVALIRAKLAGAPVILGSATPMIETFHQALAGEHTLLSMPTRVSGKLPNVTVVDMREELKRGNRSVISGVLAETLSGALARGEQAIVLLNRRGYATFVLCRECGHVLTCGHCS